MTLTQKILYFHHICSDLEICRALLWLSRCRMSFLRVSLHKIFLPVLTWSLLLSPVRGHLNTQQCFLMRLGEILVYDKFSVFSIEELKLILFLKQGEYKLSNIFTKPTDLPSMLNIAHLKRKFLCLKLGFPVCCLILPVHCISSNTCVV